jgi:hypothetical protein
LGAVFWGVTAHALNFTPQTVGCLATVCLKFGGHYTAW